MIITLDGQPVRMQPSNLNWEPPAYLGTNGVGMPIHAPTWTCRLVFPNVTKVQYTTWRALWVSGDEFDAELPNPDDGTMTTYTCRMSEFRANFDTRAKRCAVASGVDITLANIEVD